MRAKISIRLFAAFVIVMAAAFAAYCAEFSADMAMNSAAGGEMTGKVFVKGNALRQEINTPMGVQALIVDPDAPVSYAVMPEQNMYMEIPKTQITLGEDETFEEKFSEQGKVTEMGDETVQGYDCRKYHVVFNDANAGEATIWLSEDLNYPIKVYSENPQDKLTVIYSNIQEEPQPDSLFTIPEGYTKMDMKMIQPE
ncbi:MAG: DUF4412 domain-containing protein [Synergistota bacterium]|nr:DUF4412 domain-containing protein [Synergistota bacterium]